MKAIVKFAAVTCAACAAFGASAAYTSALYVQDGLVMHWDAIDNAGVGTHDASATTWVDLTGNGYDWTINLAKGSWTDDGLVMNGSGTVGSSSKSASDFNNKITTVEFVYANAEKRAGIIFVPGFGASTYLYTDTDGHVGFYGPNGGTRWGAAVALNEAIRYSVIYTRTGATPSGVTSFTTNEVAGTNAKMNDYWGGNMDAPLLGSRNGGSVCAKGTLKALRIYNRVLTDAEREQNALVDRVRFFGYLAGREFDGFSVTQGAEGALQANCSFSSGEVGDEVYRVGGATDGGTESLDDWENVTKIETLASADAVDKAYSFAEAGTTDLAYRFAVRTKSNGRLEFSELTEIGAAARASAAVTDDPEGTTAELVGRISNCGRGKSSVDVYAAIGTEKSGLGAYVKIAEGLGYGASFTYTFTGLEKGKYLYGVKFVNGSEDLVLEDFFIHGCWTYDATAKTITDGTWVLPVSWTAGSSTITVSGITSGSGELDLRDLAVDGTPIRSLKFTTGAFVGKGLTGFKANNIGCDLYRTFNSCTSLTSVEIAGEGVTKLEASSNCGVFEGCSQLVSVKLDCPNLVTLGAFTYLSCGKLATPAGELAPRTVRNIGERAFISCGNVHGKIVLDRCDHLGPQAFNGCGLQDIAIGKGDFTVFPAAGSGVFEKCYSLTNVSVAAENLSVTKYTFLDCSKLRRIEFDVPGTVTVTQVDREFGSCSALSELVFAGPAPTATELDRMLVARSASAGAKPVTIYASQKQEGWTDLVAGLTDAEKEIAPEGCFGVYREESRKAWVVQKNSPYDKATNTLIVQPNLAGIGRPSVPYDTYTEVAPGTVFSVGEYDVAEKALYRAGGYTLESYDESTETWVEEETSTDLAYTYAASDRKLRLTWNFSLAGYEIKVTNADASSISVSPAPVFENCHPTGTDVTLTANDIASPAATFLKWLGDLAEGADATQRAQTVTADRARSLTAAYKTLDWTFDAETGTLSDSVWSFKATFDDATGTLSVTKVNSGSGIIDWRDITVNGTNVTSLALASSLFAGNTTVREFYANHLADTLVRTFMSSHVEKLDLAGEAVTALRSNGSDGFAESCSYLTEVRLDFPNLAKYEKYAFFKCYLLVGDIADFVTPGVKTVGFSAFFGDGGLRGKLTLADVDSVGAEAFCGTGIREVEWTGGDIAMANDNYGIFEKCYSLTNVAFHAKSLKIGQWAFCDDTSLRSVTYDVEGVITNNCALSDSNNKPFKNCPVSTLVFAGPAPIAEVIDEMLVARTASAGEKPTTIYCSKKQEGWLALASPFTDDEREIAPEKCFGVYREGSRKAWLVHRASRFDKQGLSVFIK